MRVNYVTFWFMQLTSNNFIPAEPSVQVEMLPLVLEATANTQNPALDHVTLKVRDQSGEEMFFKVEKGTAMKKIMQAFADRKGVSLEVLRFTFDGTRLNAKDTPKMLKFQDGAWIDAHLERRGGGGDVVTNENAASSQSQDYPGVDAIGDDLSVYIGFTEEKSTEDGTRVDTTTSTNETNINKLNTTTTSTTATATRLLPRTAVQGSEPARAPRPSAKRISTTPVATAASKKSTTSARMSKKAKLSPAPKLTNSAKALKEELAHKLHGHDEGCNEMAIEGDQDADSSIPDEHSKPADGNLLGSFELQRRKTSYSVRIIKGGVYAVLGLREKALRLFDGISQGVLKGMPDDLVSVHVTVPKFSEIEDITVLEYIMTDPKVIANGASEEKVRAMFTDMGFGASRTAAAIEAGVGTLSGGWRVKLALSRAMLLNPDMLLLVDPTKDLDQFAVKWLTDYVKNLKTCTCLLVSDDAKFLDAVSTSIIHWRAFGAEVFNGTYLAYKDRKDRPLDNTDDTATGALRPTSNSYHRRMPKMSKQAATAKCKAPVAEATLVFKETAPTSEMDNFFAAATAFGSERGEGLDDKKMARYHHLVNTIFDGKEDEVDWDMMKNTKGARKHATNKYTRFETLYKKSEYESRVMVECQKGLLSDAPAVALSALRRMYDLVSLSSSTANADSLAVAMGELKTAVQACILQSASAEDPEGRWYSDDTIKALRSVVESGGNGGARAAEDLQIVIEALVHRKKQLADDIEKLEVRNFDEGIAMGHWYEKAQGAGDFKAETEETIQEFKRKEELKNKHAYEDLRKIITRAIARLPTDGYMDLASSPAPEGGDGFIPRDLAQEVVKNKLLHLLIMHPNNISNLSFLYGGSKAIFEGFTSLDIRELRALAYILPNKFEKDNAGLKAAWRIRVYEHTMQLVSREDGVLLPGDYCPLLKARKLTAQKPLAPNERCRKWYFYPECKDFDKKIKDGEIRDKKEARLLGKRPLFEVSCIFLQFLLFFAILLQ